MVVRLEGCSFIDVHCALINYIHQQKKLDASDEKDDKFAQSKW